MMKAIVKEKRAPGLVMKTCPIPEVKDDEVRIKIHTTAICGTDVHIYNWDAWAQKNVPVPLIIGHEFMGRIEKVGKKVTRYKVGDRVTGEGHITCGTCLSCKNGQKHLCLNTKGIGYHVPGCFAEYFVLREENLILLPDTISDDVAAILDPLGNAVHTALSFDLAGEDVLITGAGPLGILATAVCHRAAARYIVITDHNEFRLHLAQRMGASIALCVPEHSIDDAMKRLGMENGFSVGLEMSGSFDALNDIL
jgi:threonine 3-dehydrogenase